MSGSVLGSEPETENGKQRKRGILNDGWIGISNPYGYGHGQPWSENSNPWKALKVSSGLHHNHGGYKTKVFLKLFFENDHLLLMDDDDFPWFEDGRTEALTSIICISMDYTSILMCRTDTHFPST